jgi:carboxylesterase type B
VIQANALPPKCPQAANSNGNKSLKPGGTNQSEDCLFLSVYAPPNAANLPVLVWIRE